MFSDPIYLNSSKPSGFEGYDEIEFKHGVTEIKLYKIQFKIKKPHDKKVFEEKKIAFLVELHCYSGFAMVKFYPKRYRGNSNKYKMRCHEIGYTLNFSQVRHILLCCSKIMKNYLDNNPNDLVGYIAQPDSYDDKRNRMNSHRSIIYNPFTKSIFIPDKYDVSSIEHPFMLFNVCVVRNILPSEDAEKLSSEQQSNLGNIYDTLRQHKEEIPSFMTRRRQIDVFGEPVIYPPLDEEP